MHGALAMFRKEYFVDVPELLAESADHRECNLHYGWLLALAAFLATFLGAQLLWR